MPRRRRRVKDVNRPDLHIANYLDHPNYGSRMLQCNQYMPPDRYNPIVEGYEALETECLGQFGVAPMKSDCRGSFIKLVWFRTLKDRLVLVDDIQIQSWGSTYLAHLYRSLCRATRVDCKEIDGPLTLLLAWAWTRLPFIAPIPSNPQIFPIANRFHNWKRQNRPYRFRTLETYRRDLDFVWEPYAIGRTDPEVIPPDIRQHSAIWSATVPLISFECIEWHASDRLRRQFGLTQGIPNQERDLGEAHGEVLTGEPRTTITATTIATATTAPSQTQAQQEPEQFTPYIPDMHSADYLTPPVYQQYWSVPHQESSEQGSFSQLLGFWLLLQVTHIQLTETFPPVRWPNRAG
ncbi:hypothetical protein Ahy_A02g007417 [Arachis hypogaea]|uniref:Aminotransferase-like plant mobile domain-containing protein n=1 Tax=Arachis hypogaea TaxID=3818 RepID=A0A445ECG0_ARAHY|nr:hypothetical protein Ahy_A02g007417 [Arachis hypogaea]